MLLDEQDSQLVLVDYQARLMPALEDGSAALANAVRLAQAAQLLSVPIWGTEQNPDKLHFSACADGLVELLRPPARAPSGNARSLPKHLQKPQAAAPERPSIVIAGCEAHVCLMQTALDLLEEEFEVWVVTDACASRTLRNRDAAYDRLAGAGAELVTTEMVLFEWLRTAESPVFKQMQALIK